MNLIEGQRLISVVGQMDMEGGCLHMTVGGESGAKCESIVVSMEQGQMACVPWARCEKYNGLVVMVNLATVESVVLDPNQDSPQ